MTTRVLLVDDQSLLRMGFRMVLETEPDIEVVGEAGDGAQGVAMTRALSPDVVLMDVRMPVMGGIEATRQIVESGSPSRVLVLTTFDLDEFVFAALRAGASGFLLKDALPSDLANGIRAVAAGDAVVAPGVTRRLIDQFAGHLPDPATGRSPLEEELHDLSDREREVLMAVARGRLQRRNRGVAVRVGGDGQDPRQPHPPQAQPARSGSGGGVRLRSGNHPSRRGLTRPLRLRRYASLTHTDIGI